MQVIADSAIWAIPDRGERIEGFVQRGEHNNPAGGPDLHLYAWETPDLDPDALTALESEVESLAGNAVVLSTCQRLEVYACQPLSLRAPASARGLEALRHACAVAAGLESLVLGEREIFDQARAAARVGPADARRALLPALHAARRLRREQAFDGDSGRLLDMALALAGEKPGGRLLVVGPGKAGRLVAARGGELGFEVYLSGRRQAPDVSEECFLPLSRLSEARDIDVLVVCLGRHAPALSEADLPRVARLVVDLSTPRKVHGGSSKPLVDIAALLASRPERAADDRAVLRRRLDEILDDELRRQSERASPMTSVRAEIEKLRQREIERTLRLHPGLPAETLDVVTKALVNQIFDRPMRAMRQTSDPAFHRRVAALWLERPRT